MEVESDFAKCDYARMLAPAFELRQMCVGNFFGFVRMDAHACVNPRMLLGVRQAQNPTFPGRDQCQSREALHACSASAFEHRRRDLRQTGENLYARENRSAPWMLALRARVLTSAACRPEYLPEIPRAPACHRGPRMRPKSCRWIRRRAIFAERDSRRRQLFCPTKFFRFVTCGDARDDLANFVADIHYQLQKFIGALHAFGGFQFARRAFRLS